MHIDARTLDDGTLIEGDICIIGAGAAGVSMALEWKGRTQKVILLEGGGFEVEAEIQDLYRGENIGQRYYPLQSSRLHLFGGTMGHWGGFCARLDPWDFEQRDWVPHSGWPISREDLDPYYDRAAPIVDIGPSEWWDSAYWQEQGATSLPLDETKVWTKMWQFSTPTRFGTHYRDEIVQASNIHLYTHANVCDIKANEAVSAIEEVEIRNFDGSTHRVRARHFVLACGAIQNARLLLASNRQAPNGLGNDRDLVGRFFMEHIEAPVALLFRANPDPMSLYTNLRQLNQIVPRGELALSYAQQKNHRILNCSSALAPGPGAENLTNFIDIYPESAEETVVMSDQMIENRANASRTDATDLGEIMIFRMNCRSETAPNPDSRIQLSEEIDALGMPRVQLNWQLTELEKHTLVKTFELMGEEFGRSGVGRVQIREWLLEEDPFSSPNSMAAAGWHHMGTTRMHNDPQQGVVDANCKVHGLGNLYVAGSAAFPTAGVANPTLTLIALTLRLSDQLKDKMG